MILNVLHFSIITIEIVLSDNINYQLPLDNQVYPHLQIKLIS